MKSRPRIAFWFRYGAAEHAELYHALPRLLEELSATTEVHFFGFKGRWPVPESITRHAIVHQLPFKVDRTNGRDKVVKTMLWLACLPWVGLWSRWLGIRGVYMDETVPLTALVARICFGRRVGITVADFFVDIYLKGSVPARMLARLLRWIDLSTWRRLPLIITRARHTRRYLVKRGFDPSRIRPIYDPVDANLYHPGDRVAARAVFGYQDDEVVLVHHGIMHPNKGNDRIIRALAKLRPRAPQIRYLLIGDGPEFVRLRAMVEELGLQDVVRMTGWLSRPEDVNVALNAGDIGLVMRVGHESDDFHVTGALVHNMAAGLPILAARLGGVSEVVEDGVQGRLFPPDDMDIFSERLIEMATDAEKRSRMGRAALEQSQKSFDLEAVVRQTADALAALWKP